jgi:hypothetical protein
MRKRRVTSLFAVICCLGAFAAPPASASETEQFMNTTFLESGHNHFSSSWYQLFWVWGKSNGAAAACVGASGYPEYQVCRGEYEEAKTEYIGLKATGYLHNHSTWNSYFNAWARGEH